MIKGKVDHRDSEDNHGTIYPGDLQWMSAGSGIFHEEMPKYIKEKNKIYPDMVGFQLWINLPANRKMSTPVYRSIKGKDVPSIRLGSSEIKLIAGRFGNDYGAYDGGTQDVTYMHVKLNDDRIAFSIKESYRAIIYVFE